MRFERRDDAESLDEWIGQFLALEQTGWKGLAGSATAFDERYARYSPGVPLQRENLAILGRRDIAWNDSCAAADHPMIDHIWRERRAIGRLSIAIGGPLRRAVFAGIAAAETHRAGASR